MGFYASVSQKKVLMALFALIGLMLSQFILQ